MFFQSLSWLLLLPSAPPRPPPCQTVDYTTLYTCVKELSGVCVPARVENVLQENAYNLLIQLKTNQSIPGGKNELNLLFNWHPQAARLGIGRSAGYYKDPASNERLDTSFCTSLKCILKGKMIVSISIPVSFERIVHIDFSDRSSSSPSPSSTPIASASHRLIMEIAGPRSNLILVSLADQSILACAYQVSSAASIRPLQLLGRYAAPPPSSGVLDPTSLDAKSLKLFAHHLKSVSKQRLEKALYSALKGMSPSVAKRIMERATLSPSSSLDDLDDLSVAKLYDSILDWAAIFRSESTVLMEPVQEGSGYALVLPTDRENMPSRTAPSSLPVCEHLFSYYSNFERQVDFSQLKASCDRKLGLLFKKAFKMHNDFSAQLNDAESGKASELSAKADLITAYTYAYKKGQPFISCVDFDTGEPVDIPLPPGILPNQLADKLFAKARKLRRSVIALRALLNEVDVQLNYLRELEASLLTLQEYRSYDDIVTLREIDEELISLTQRVFLEGVPKAAEEDEEEEDSVPSKAPKKIRRSHLQKKKGRATVEVSAASKKSKQPVAGNKVKGVNNLGKSSMPKKGSMAGLLVLRPKAQEDGDSLPPLVVGRSSKQNERVTFELGRDHHLWFHVQGFPGSHCLLQLEPGAAASEESLQYAADVAAFYSQGRGSTQVPVTYCSPKYIKRITGGSPGSVSILQQQGVVYASPERGKMWAEKYGPTSIAL